MRSTIAAAAFALLASASPVELSKRGDCSKQALGSGPASTPDTAAAFVANPIYNQIANAAQDPAGFVPVFKAYNASNNADKYIWYQTITKYDPAVCAAKCKSIDGCTSFNIYFERDPTLDADKNKCNNPASTVNIKCAYWGAPVSLATAVNYGQWRAGFQVVIAGSNSYNLNPTPGYTSVSLGNATINAPLDCNGANTYLQVVTFQVSTFDASLCTKACDSQTAYNTAHPPQDGSKPMLCNSVAAWLELRNGQVVQQQCALYNQTWDASYATNFGQMQGADTITVASSFVFSNITNPGVCTPN